LAAPDAAQSTRFTPRKALAALALPRGPRTSWRRCRPLRRRPVRARAGALPARAWTTPAPTSKGKTRP